MRVPEADIWVCRGLCESLFFVFFVSSTLFLVGPLVLLSVSVLRKKPFSVMNVCVHVCIYVRCVCVVGGVGGGGWGGADTFFR